MGKSRAGEALRVAYSLVLRAIFNKDLPDAANLEFLMAGSCDKLKRLPQSLIIHCRLWWA